MAKRIADSEIAGLKTLAEVLAENPALAKTTAYAPGDEGILVRLEVPITIDLNLTLQVGKTYDPFLRGLFTIPDGRVSITCSDIKSPTQVTGIVKYTRVRVDPKNPLKRQHFITVDDLFPVA
jgi:hypothetical protein